MHYKSMGSDSTLSSTSYRRNARWEQQFLLQKNKDEENIRHTEVWDNSPPQLPGEKIKKKRHS